MRTARLIILLFIIACSEPDFGSCIDTNCADYSSQAAAQADFNADPECRNDLDHDNDGKACEDWFNSTGGTGGGCPTTANCGCSNKNKSSCASACCEWIVGTGCRCS
ncbi:MAG: hypothetical protein RJQ14_18975 [Marinoscillum sp.]